MKNYFNLYLVLTVLISFSADAQDYYWIKADGFPQGIATDLEAADNVIRYNAQWYSYESDIDFKRIESLIDQDPSKPGNFYWTGPEGKWILEDEQNITHPHVFTLDGTTKEVKTLCTTNTYRYTGRIDKENIILYKNDYYTLGQNPVNGIDTRLFKRYNKSSCTWDIIQLPTNPRIDGEISQLISDGTYMYIVSRGNPRGDIQCHATQDAINWETVIYPTNLLNNAWYDPKWTITADKRGFVIMKFYESDVNTNQDTTRFFKLINKQFVPITMQSGQPSRNNWLVFKYFDSGTLYSINYLNEVFQSKDEGENWKKIRTINTPPRINDFIETRDGKFYIATDSGVYVMKKAVDPTPTGCSDLAFKRTVNDEIICKKGDATFVVSGGSAPYTIKFKNQNYTITDTIKLPMLENGYHEVKITDTKGCVIYTDFYINYIVKEAMQTAFNNTSICNANYSISFSKGYPPYQVSWTDTSAHTKLYDVNPSAPNTSVRALFTLQLPQTYTFTISDQSGCAPIQNTQQGLLFNPILSYKGTPACDSVDITITNANSPYNEFKLYIKDITNTIIQTTYWTGVEKTIRLKHDAYYNFEITTIEGGCSKSIAQRFSRATLGNFNLSNQGCNTPDGKGRVQIFINNYNSALHKIIWSDIGVSTLLNRTGLSSGHYTVDVIDVTGCGVHKEFEITNVPAPKMPQIPFLCPEETFTVLPQVETQTYRISFIVYDQNNHSVVVPNGQGFEITNDQSSTYSMITYNTSTGCHSDTTRFTIKEHGGKPLIDQSNYTFCNIDDTVSLTAVSSDTYWYSGIDSSFLGMGPTLSYQSRAASDSIHLYLQSRDATCQSEATTIMLQQNTITKPSIGIENSIGGEKILKPTTTHSADDTFAWYVDDNFLQYGDSLIIASTEQREIRVEAMDATGCLSKKSDPYIHQVTTATLETEKPFQLAIYPNPSSTNITISSNKNLSGALITIRDISSKIIKQTVADESTITLSIDTLASGMYILEINLEEIHANSILIKQ